MMRIAADLRGGHVGLVEPGRVLLVELPSLAPSSELGIAGDLGDHDVTFVGATGKLAVLSRSQGRAVLHVVDPAGPTKLGEVQFRNAARILAVAGPYILTASGNVTAVVDVGAPDLIAIPLPTRGAVTLAARIGPTSLALAIGGAVEQWDVATRTPGRRLRLDTPIDPIFLGGNADRVWWIPRDAPGTVELIALATRSTRRIDLPEPAALVDAHPSGDLVAVIGATTGQGFVVDLVRPGQPLGLERGALDGLAWVDRGNALIVKPLAGPLELFAAAEAGAPEPAAAPALSAAAAAITPPLAAPAGPKAGGTTSEWSRDEISRRLAAWRKRFVAKGGLDDGGDDHDGAPIDPAAAPEAEAAERDDASTSTAGSAHPVLVAVPNLPSDPHPVAVVTEYVAEHGAAYDSMPIPIGGWRAELANWARGIQSGSTRDLPDTSVFPPLEVLCARLGLSESVRQGLALVYGAYLCGTPEIAPVELAQVTGWSWAEGLGGGALGEHGLVRARRGRLWLVAEARAVLDERPPITGDAHDGRLVATKRGARRPDRHALEARLRGLVAADGTDSSKSGILR